VLPPPTWPSSGPNKFSSSSSQLWLSDKLFGDFIDEQEEEQSAPYYYDDVEGGDPAAATSFSSSIIIASALQDRLVKLAAKAAAAAQQQLYSPTASTTSSSSSSNKLEDDSDVATILQQLGSLPMSMTVKREQEMLQLAGFFDSLYPKLSEAAAAAALNDLDLGSAAVLDAVLVDGLPALQLGKGLAGLMAAGDAAMLRSMLHAHMAELFADFMTLVSCCCCC
jgi:hypothetical protein